MKTLGLLAIAVIIPVVAGCTSTANQAVSPPVAASSASSPATTQPTPDKSGLKGSNRQWIIINKTGDPTVGVQYVFVNPAGGSKHSTGKPNCTYGGNKTIPSDSHNYSNLEGFFDGSLQEFGQSRPGFLQNKSTAFGACDPTRFANVENTAVIVLAAASWEKPISAVMCNDVQQPLSEEWDCDAFTTRHGPGTMYDPHPAPNADTVWVKATSGVQTCTGSNCAAYISEKWNQDGTRELVIYPPRQRN